MAQTSQALWAQSVQQFQEALAHNWAKSLQSLQANHLGDLTANASDLKAAPVQFDQDKILNEGLFRNKKNGVFVDIGAYDGICGSNTYFFEKHLNKLR